MNTEALATWMNVIVAGLAISVLLLAFLHRYFAFLQKPWQAYRRSLAIVIPALAIFALSIGYLCWEPQPAQASFSFVESDAIEFRPGRSVNAIRLLKLLATETAEPWGTFGRSATVLLWLLVGIELQRLLFYKALNAVHNLTLIHHTVICGCGSIGYRIFQDIKSQRPWFGEMNIVVIESNVENPNLDDVRESGAMVVIGDATDPRVLKSVHVMRAKKLFAFSGSDERNAEIVARVGHIANDGPNWTDKVLLILATILNPIAWQSSRKQSQPIRCYAHIENRELAAAANRFDTNTEHDEIEISFVDPAELAATQLLLDQVLKKLTVENVRERKPHFVLIGFDQQGQAVANQIAQVMHLENEARSRMTIIHESKEQKAAFLNAYPAFAPNLSSFNSMGLHGYNLPAAADDYANQDYRPLIPKRDQLDDDGKGVDFVCNAEFILNSGDPVDDKLIDGIEYLMQMDRSREDMSESGRRPCTSLPVIIVCTSDDKRNAAIAERVKEQIERLSTLKASHPWALEGLPVYVSITENEGLHTLIETQKTSEPVLFGDNCRVRVDIGTFAKTDQILTYEKIVNSGTRALAKVLNASFDEEFEFTLECAPEIEQKWSESDFWERKSNLDAAIHAPIKGRILGIDLSPYVLADVDAVLKN